MIVVAETRDSSEIAILLSMPPCHENIVELAMQHLSYYSVFRNGEGVGCLMLDHRQPTPILHVALHARKLGVEPFRQLYAILCEKGITRLNAYVPLDCIRARLCMLAIGFTKFQQDAKACYYEKQLA